MEIKSDQKIAAQTDALPADEQQHVVVRQYQHQHEEHEKVQVAEEPVVSGVVRHVADGVNVNQKADAGDYQNHHRAERVQQKSPVGGEGGQAAVSHVERQSGQPSELNYLMDLLCLAR